MNNIKYLFGFPTSIVKLKANKYNKKEIINTIEKNYNIDNNRNEWRNEWDKISTESSKLHHAYDDWDNSKFLKPNFDLLIKHYKIIITKFLNKLHFKNTVNFKFSIANYTCMKNNQFMNEHIHPYTDFTLIHYIKFNKKIHQSTHFKNTHSHSNFSGLLNKKLLQNLDLSYIENSNLCNVYKFNIDEDDICIVPGLIPHFVPISKNVSETRITIVSNINIL